MARQNLSVFVHAATMGDHWREIVAELVGMIDGSGLYDAADSLRCIVVGGGNTRYLASRGLPKWTTVEYGGWLDEYEYPTLRDLWSYAKDHDGYVLYIHSKGASSNKENAMGAYGGKRFRDRWRKIMAYFLVTRWRDRVAELAGGVDAVGAFLIGGDVPHYSGNFWWATSAHIRRLPEPAPMTPGQRGGEHPRLWAELWLQSIPGNYLSCYDHPVCINTEFVSGSYRA